MTNIHSTARTGVLTLNTFGLIAGLTACAAPIPESVMQQNIARQLILKPAHLLLAQQHVKPFPPCQKRTWRCAHGWNWDEQPLPRYRTRRA